MTTKLTESKATVRTTTKELEVSTPAHVPATSKNLGTLPKTPTYTTFAEIVYSHYYASPN